LTLGPLARLELACHDLQRQREFYARILQLPVLGPGPGLSFAMGPVTLVLRPRGDVLFPAAAAGPCEPGTLIALTVEDAELDRWHRRMLTLRVAVLDAPGPSGAPPRMMRVADPEGNVIELFVPA
jgi:catechol 2,3-dioxygenase-like lactoylglutathione lyase family enzyme